MKRSLWTVLIAVLALATQTASAEYLAFDFASLSGSSIRFNGTTDTIDFPTVSPNDFGFAITDATSSSLGGLKGKIGGTFQVGPIVVLGTIEQANITTTNGFFSVYDGVSDTLTAELDWKDVIVISKLVGGMNVSGIANLNNVSYSGNNAELLSLKDGSEQTATLSFQFSAGSKKSLNDLMATGQVTSTSYSGSVSAIVPEPSSCALLVVAGLGLVGCVWRRRRS